MMIGVRRRRGNGMRLMLLVRMRRRRVRLVLIVRVRRRRRWMRWGVFLMRLDFLVNRPTLPVTILVGRCRCGNRQHRKGCKDIDESHLEQTSNSVSNFSESQYCYGGTKRALVGG
jgi:hypothetical protein